MTDLRCSSILHAKAYGNVIEVRCFSCGRVPSDDGERQSVYHAWRLIDGQWDRLPDRVEPLDGTRKLPGSRCQTVVK